jgi:hypothetical protein
MTGSRQQALESVDSVLAQLEALGDAGSAWHEGNGGWTTRSRKHWIKQFGEIREGLLAGHSDFDYLGHHLIRVLDHDGVIGGPILKDAAELQGHLLVISKQAST